MNSISNIIGKFVKWSEDAKKLGESWADSKSNDGTPNEKFVNGGFGNVALAPSNAGMKNVSQNNSDSSRN